MSRFRQEAAHLWSHELGGSAAVARATASCVQQSARDSVMSALSMRILTKQRVRIDRALIDSDPKILSAADRRTGSTPFEGRKEKKCLKEFMGNIVSPCYVPQLMRHFSYS